uniref:Serrate RNA effector molecule homolog n=1 Tax=Dermatophagoides pteronyssinus TaxID=6956 RepID=A0A6P6XSK6_DERPT|nr:serrate RNA effector molecule homolog isoform X2 [Dermatophagoides pteronyssinus]
MADSDDDYDRRRGRDKFRRERNDYNDRNVNNRRDDWTPDSWSSQRDRNQSSGGGGRRDYRDNYNSGRMNYSRNDRYSPADRNVGGDMSPPIKRIRSTGVTRDWDERYSNYDSGYGHGVSVGVGHHNIGITHYRDNYGQHDRERDDEYQPPMMTFKQFVNEQDDHLDVEILITKYNDYKCDFKRTQIQEFFNRHKDEEWFRCKYFPDEMERRKTKMQQTYQNRLNVFMELYEKKYFDNVSLDVDKAEQIIKVLDAAVIKMEGGNDFDLNALNNEFDEQQQQQKNTDSIFAIDSSSTTKASFTTTTTAAAATIGSSVSSSGGDKTIDDNVTANDNCNVDDNDNNDAKMHDESDQKNNDDEEDKMNAVDEEKPMIEDGEASQTPKTMMDDHGESGDGELIEEGEDASKDDIDEHQQQHNDSKQQQQQSQEKNESENSNEKKPRALHKTCSIFFRNIAPSITRQEIEDECRKFPGFLRLAISEPQMDRRFNRRGWATYERTVNIREICWNLNNVKIRGTELSPIVNRDLTRRIRSINGISSDKTVVRADIRHAAKLIMKLDQQKKLWEETEDEANNNEPRNGSTNTLSTPSRNPLMKNITDYLIEEASAEEAELLGTSVEDPAISSAEIGESGETNGNSTSCTNDGTQLERDEELIKVLDRLLFYLRIVHSIDYYNHCDYANEDEMPNRIGLVHARGLISSARVTSVEITEYIKDFENKILSTLLKPIPEITAEEAKKLGLKNIDDAVDAFIKENTKELGEGKWLCPLSNKKFMGPEFVRKHILNKHGERVEQVKAETVYFNNYIMDPKRPQLPEHPLNRPPQLNQQQSSQQQQQTARHEPLLSGPHGFVYNHRGGAGGGNHMPNIIGGNVYPRFGNPHPPPYLLHGQIMDSYMRPNLKRRYRDLDAPNEE